VASPFRTIGSYYLGCALSNFRAGGIAARKSRRLTEGQSHIREANTGGKAVLPMPHDSLGQSQKQYQCIHTGGMAD
jgi:hypothetical protein